MKSLIMGTIGSVIYERLVKQYEVYGTYHKNKPLHVRKEYIYQQDLANHEVLDQILNELKPDWIISSLTGDFDHLQAVFEKSGIRAFAPSEVKAVLRELSLKWYSFLHFQTQFDVTNASWRIFKHCLGCV